MSILTISALSLVELFGDAQFKFFARTGEQKYLVNGFVGYIGVMYFLVKALKSANIMYVNGMWDGISALLNTIGVYFLLGERLNTSGQYAGLIFIMGGVFLMHRDGISY